MRIRKMEKVDDGTVEEPQKKVTFIDDKLRDDYYLNNDANTIGNLIRKVKNDLTQQPESTQEEIDA